MRDNEYVHLTPTDREHFVEHGWLLIPNAINPAYLDPWLENLWTRLGYDEKDPKTWKSEYLKMPRHREVPNEEFCTPEAWGKLTELVGGKDKIHDTRERYFGDQFIINFGSEYWSKALTGELDENGNKVQEMDPREAKGWHIDNDWYRQFLDSSGNALTSIFLFTDCPEKGGGTFICEDGIKGACEYLLAHPEGLDHPYDEIVAHIPKCNKFRNIVGKKGDLIATHQMLPHSHAPNYLRYARVITNPHVNMKEDYNLNREDGNYSLCEQVLLRALGRDSVPPEIYTPTRPHLVHYPRTAHFKRARINEELERLQAEAKSKGLSPDSVDSVYLKGEDAIREHEFRNGYDQEWGPNGVIGIQEVDTNIITGHETSTLYVKRKAYTRN